MLFLHTNNIWFLLGSLAVAVCLYYLHNFYKYETRIKEREKALGCVTAKRIPSWDPLFGIDTFAKIILAVRNHTLLTTAQQQFHGLKTWTIKYTVLGNSIFLTADPENVKAVLSLNFNSYEIGDEREKAVGSFLGKGIFTSDGEAWKHSRTMLRPSFVKTELADLEIFEPHVQGLIQNIKPDTSVDLSPLFSVFTFDVATAFLLGKSTNCLTNGDNSAAGVAFAEAFDRIKAVLSGEGPLGILGLWLPSLQYKRDLKICHRFVDGFVDRNFEASALEKFSDHDQVFLHRLVTQTDDKVKIRSEILNILLAGRDTTAAALTNVWFCVARHPSVTRKLRAEVDYLNGRAPDLAQLHDLKYFKAVVNEVLRLYPIVPENARKAREDSTIPRGGGENDELPLFVAKGQVVGFNIYTMHRRKDIFGEDAGEFRPERWLDAENETPLRPGWGFLPFSGGPRVCIGQQFALIEVIYTTVRLLQAFAKIESRDEKPWSELLRMTCSSLNGCKVKLSK